MDRNWITTTKIGDPIYNAGVLEFIKFAVGNKSDGCDKMPCPCFMCHNLIYHKVDTILSHLGKWEFDRTYTYWYRHGEKKEGNSSMGSFTQGHYSNEGDRLEEMIDGFEERANDDPIMAEELLNESEKPLYSGCSKYTRMKSVLKLYNLKAAHGWTDKSFSALLELLTDMLPPDNVLPSGTYEAKKILSTMGLSYEKIHACPKDCILYRKEFEFAKSCPECGVSRYKNKEGVPAKVLWYFPIIERFKRMYSNPEDAQNLTWHKFGQKNDGLLRHPADSPQWRFFDKEYSDFGQEERNLRLALSTDGMNPFSSLGSTHSTWPVMLVSYNLPSSLCMKRKYIMLSMIISGPKQPGNDIDVYLEPLIDDFMLLWEKGVEVFDAHRKEMFNLRAMLFCTIQDFSAYGNLSGYTVKGFFACPICEDGWPGEYMSGSKKTVFFDHRSFLPCEHGYRSKKKAFTGEQCFKSRPKVFTGVEVFEKVKDIEITFGKLKKNKAVVPTQGYKKCSGFWRLPYWKSLFVRHCLDIMHIEKNVFDSLIGTLLNIPGKSKDSVGARVDLQNMGIRDELHVTESGNRKYLPPAAYTLSRKEKVELCASLAGVKVPEGYSSNISSLISMENLKLVGLKSHDCHVLMQHLLPVAIRSILPKNVRYAIVRLCSFFNAIYSKVIRPADLESLETEIVVILCQLEMYFPPAFFDIMIHLPIHLVREIKLLGPVHMRSEWTFEKQMKTYKGYVKNAYRPEACVAQRMLYELAVEFSTENIGDMKTVGLPISRHSGQFDGRGTIGRRDIDLPSTKWHMAHTYILHNEDEVAPYVDRHISFLKTVNRRASQKAIATEHNKSFRIWFKNEIMKELCNSSHSVSDRLKSLAYGPDFSVSFFSAYVINGYTFYTKEQDDKSTQQNSGVSLEAEAMHFASAKDKHPVLSKMQYYGVIEEICELHYSEFSIPVFCCKWADNNNNVVHDDLGHTSMNLTKLGHKEDPYILASQAKQVFYMVDPLDKSRSVVITPRPRYIIDDHDDNIEFEERSTPQVMDDNAEDTLTYIRSDHEEGMWVENENANPRGPKKR